MEQKRNDIVVVVDPQNLFCKEGGVCFNAYTDETRKGVEATIKNIASFLSHRKMIDVLRVYLCANKSLRGENHEWQQSIVTELSGFPHEIFWREIAASDPLDEEFFWFLQKSKNPRLVICGFFADRCVTRAAIQATEKGIPVVFITDTIYPTFTEEMKLWAIEGMRRERKGKPSLISFSTSSAYIQTKKRPH